MLSSSDAWVAIVDYGMGNLFSVKQACERVGLAAKVTPSSDDVRAASAVILPGVGAFGDAMDALRRLGLVDVLRDVAAAGTPLMGICLGLQLLMRTSHEFGVHGGLGLVDGDVVRLDAPAASRRLKVPHIGWNRLEVPRARSWSGSWLEGVREGAWMYFVHSFYVRPADPDLVISTTRWGDVDVCSSLQSGNLFGCQFHPERSGPEGLRIYRNFAARLQQMRSAA